MRVLVTGSSGLIGSEAVAFFCELGFEVWGIDNNMRADFFGPTGDTSATRRRLTAAFPNFRDFDLDIRDADGVTKLFAECRPDAVVHAAAQPSHDLAAQRPVDDFTVNANGTLTLLEATRKHAPNAAFCFLSTNKVYGDRPNSLPLVELPTRFDFAEEAHQRGIDETLPIDQSLHSLFGVSKVSADLLTQEYGRYFGMKTAVFRGGCLTGPQHAGVELHGFLNHLVRCAMTAQPFTIYGFRGKQVRDQIHAHDVVTALWEFIQAPASGAVYNIGGGRSNAGSILECITLIEEITGRHVSVSFSDTPRVGDHICYYTSLEKLQREYPAWRLTYSLRDIIGEISERNPA